MNADAKMRDDGHFAAAPLTPIIRFSRSGFICDAQKSGRMAHYILLRGVIFQAIVSFPSRKMPLLRFFARVHLLAAALSPLPPRTLAARRAISRCGGRPDFLD